MCTPMLRYDCHLLDFKGKSNSQASVFHPMLYLSLAYSIEFLLDLWTVNHIHTHTCLLIYVFEYSQCLESLCHLGSILK